MNRDMLYVNYFESEFKGSKYSIYCFVDLINLQTYYYTSSEKLKLSKYSKYSCTLEYKNNKIKISNVIVK